MLVVHVHVQVKPECIDDFKAATLNNAQASIREPGIARFDIIQQTDDPTRFVLIEAYRDSAAPDVRLPCGACRPAILSCICCPMWR